MRAQSISTKSAAADHLSESQAGLNEESGTFAGMLGKRVRNDTSAEELRHEVDNSLDGDDAGLDSSERRERRYLLFLT
jgi:hypothetical protein